MTPTEIRYAPIEKAALALTWACERSWEYILGKSISVETDHKTPGATPECSHTGSTFTKNSKIQNATDEIPLKGEQACSRKEDVHSRRAFKIPNQKPNSEVNN